MNVLSVIKSKNYKPNPNLKPNPKLNPKPNPYEMFEIRHSLKHQSKHNLNEVVSDGGEFAE